MKILEKMDESTKEKLYILGVSVLGCGAMLLCIFGVYFGWRVIIPRFYPDFPPRISLLGATFVTFILLLILKGIDGTLSISYRIRRFLRELKELRKELRGRELEEQGFEYQKKS